MKRILLYKKMILLVFLMVTVSKIFTQVTITAVPPGPRFTLDDLWQITLVKTGTLPAGTQLNVTLNIYDSKGSKVLNGATKPFSMAKNVLNINKTNIHQYEPITLTYYQNRFKNNLGRQGGLFPAGNYKVEFIINAVGGFTEPLGRTAYNINARLTYPIQLVSVYDNDTIKDPNPNFTWIPPYPLPDGEIKYKITISEVYPAQTADAAVKENLPVLKKDIFNNNTHFYSATNPTLEMGKTYAWNVNAYDVGGNLISGSETWRFIYTEEDTIWYEPEVYYVMERELSHTYFEMDSNILPIKFEEEYRVLDSLSSIVLYNMAFDTIATEVDIPIAYEQGMNFTFISFCPDEFPITLENGLYVVEITLINNDKYYIKFKNNSPVGICAY